jgi:hypothetical protein
MLTLAAAAPRSTVAWTSDGTSHEHRGLKHRPDGTIRKVPIPPILVKMLRIHASCHGTAPDGRLFPGTRGGLLSESVYGRAWHTARPLALRTRLAATVLVPTISSTSRNQAIFVDHATGPSLPSYAVLAEDDRSG